MEKKMNSKDLTQLAAIKETMKAHSYTLQQLADLNKSMSEKLEEYIRREKSNDRF